MESCRTSKEILQEWCEQHLAPHTDWTGTRIETKFKCESVEKFVNKLYEYLDLNHGRC